MSFHPAIPILRIFDKTKARELYVGFLGLRMAWEYRFRLTRLFPAAKLGPPRLPPVVHMNTLRVALVGAIVMAAGCASYQAVPDDYTGPTATLVDSAFQDVGNKGRIFAVTAIDGNAIYDAFDDSANKSSGKGFMLTLGHAYRKVPIRPMKLTLRGSHHTAAPIQTIFNQLKGTHHSVEGTIDFTPEPDKRYVVRGRLGPDESSVWLIDERTLQVVGETIVSSKN